jgi:hypothetical protein
MRDEKELRKWEVFREMGGIQREEMRIEHQS